MEMREGCEPPPPALEPRLLLLGEGVVSTTRALSLGPEEKEDRMVSSVI